jgi:hypothetical protein
MNVNRILKNHAMIYFFYLTSPMVNSFIFKVYVEMYGFKPINQCKFNHGIMQSIVERVAMRSNCWDGGKWTCLGKSIF